MLLDNTLVFSDKQTLTGTTAAASTNTVDQGAAGDTFGNLWFCVKSDAAAGGTIKVQLQTASDAEFTGAATLFERTLTKDEMAANAMPVKVAVPVGAKRFLRVYYTPAAGGKVTAFLTDNPEVK